MSFEYLKQYAETDSQLAKVEALIKTGSCRKAAKSLGMKHQSVSETIRILKAKAALNGLDPDKGLVKQLSDVLTLDRVTDQYNPRTGEHERQWLKSKVDGETQFKLIREAVQALSEEIPKTKPSKPPKFTKSHLISKYVVTDYHIGMMAWGEETGDDWDLKIAENLLVEWFKAAIALTPDSEIGLFTQLGDFLHWDGLEAVTPTSKHILDADTRFQKLVRVAIRVLRRVISLLLQKHQHVHVICAEGNHDIASSIWLREALYVMYEDEPRITIDLNPDPYYCYEFGQNCFFFHHGHKKKMSAVDSVFVGKFREQYGRTKFHFADLGHLHHERVLESNLMVLEQHRTLASADSHASRGGWLSGRHAKVTTYHQDFGKVVEHTISPDFIAAA